MLRVPLPLVQPYVYRTFGDASVYRALVALHRWESSDILSCSWCSILRVSLFVVLRVVICRFVYDLTRCVSIIVAIVTIFSSHHFKVCLAVLANALFSVSPVIRAFCAFHTHAHTSFEGRPRLTPEPPRFAFPIPRFEPSIALSSLCAQLLQSSPNRWPSHRPRAILRYSSSELSSTW